MSEHAEGRHAQLRLVSAELSRTGAPGQVVSESPGVRPIPVGNLPFPLASFVGRSAELDRTEGLLAGNRLLTITGSGGCGKTRLAIELARRIQDRFAGGAWLVDLEPLRSADHVLTEIAAALGVEEPERDRTLADAIFSFLSSSSYLVLLDNCEHLTAAAGMAATAMLAGAPGLRILATSREPLVVPGEVTWRIPELDPDDAVALFVERAGKPRPIAA